MISVLSPAKTLDYESRVPIKDFSTSELITESKKLMKELKILSPEDLSSLMGLSEKLANLNFERNMNWRAEKKLGEHSRQAIYAFKGDVYVGLDIFTLNQKQVRFLNQHIRVLSGLYGILKPLDLIEPYRLEMGTKLRNSKGKDLYKFWNNKISMNLGKDLQLTKLMLYP